jgi:hypothetical protein
MNQHLAIKIRRFFVAKRRNSSLTAHTHALNQRALIANMDDPDLIRNPLERKFQFKPLRLLLFVFIIIFALSQWIVWYSENVSLPRYCDNPKQALAYLEKIINEKQPAGNKARRPYLIAAKILYLIPRQSNEPSEVYLNRVHNQLLNECN